MKLFSLKGMLGLAAIGGAIAYTRKHGGVKNAYQDLLAKKDQLLAKKDELVARSRERIGEEREAYVNR